MPSTPHDLSSHTWRAVVEGVVAVVLLVSLVGGLAGAATWGLLRAVGALVS
jgi:hypothetical protein